MNDFVNKIVFLLASGDAFAVGLGLAVVSLILSVCVRKRLIRSFGRILGLLGMAFVLLSSTPIPLWTYVGLFSLWLGATIVARRKSPIGWITTAAFALISVFAIVCELEHHREPTIHVSRKYPVYVIGDSISAGLRLNESTWPARLGKKTGLTVLNLAEPGATAASALSQTGSVKDPNALVMIEIGGNDMLGDASAGSFLVDLEKLLRTVHATNPRMVMFEIPLMPFKNGFGRAQRLLADKYGVAIIPKKCMSRVLEVKEATSDGLHLTDTGNEMFATSVAKLIQIE